MIHGDVSYISRATLRHVWLFTRPATTPLANSDKPVCRTEDAACITDNWRRSLRITRDTEQETQGLNKDTMLCDTVRWLPSAFCKDSIILLNCHF